MSINRQKSFIKFMAKNYQYSTNKQRELYRTIISNKTPEKDNTE